MRRTHTADAYGGRIRRTHTADAYGGRRGWRDGVAGSAKGPSYCSGVRWVGSALTPIDHRRMDKRGEGDPVAREVVRRVHVVANVQAHLIGLIPPLLNLDVRPAEDDSQCPKAATYPGRRRLPERREEIHGACGDFADALQRPAPYRPAEAKWTRALCVPPRSVGDARVPRRDQCAPPGIDRWVCAPLDWRNRGSGVVSHCDARPGATRGQLARTTPRRVQRARGGLLTRRRPRADQRPFDLTIPEGTSANFLG